MEDGAVGISTSLVYAPAFYAKTEELIELAKVASRYGGVYATHMRNESNSIMSALDEAIHIGTEANIPVEIFHLKMAGKPNWGKMRAVIAKIEAARARGIDITADQYPYVAGATSLGAALHLEPGLSILDLACGSGEMLATWSRDYGIVGTGVDISTHFLARARDRAAELGVADRIAFVHGDAGSHVSPVPVDVAACLGATWIGGGVDGTVALLDRSLRSGGVMLIGEPYWLKPPPNQDVVAACHAQSIEDFDDLPGLMRRFGRLGWDLVELVLTDPSGWDRYHGAQWRTIRL